MNVFVDVILELFTYQKEDIYYVYSPDLDLIGYGKSLKEAHNSFKIVLEEYFDYAIKNGTLKKDLEKHGWKLLENKVIPPPKDKLKKLLKDIPEIYSQIQQNYQIPII